VGKHSIICFNHSCWDSSYDLDAQPTATRCISISVLQVSSLKNTTIRYSQLVTYENGPVIQDEPFCIRLGALFVNFGVDIVLVGSCINLVVELFE
jgi:hypothetical protein